MKFSKLFSSKGFMTLLVFLLILLVAYNGHKRYELFYKQNRQALLYASDYALYGIADHLDLRDRQISSFVQLFGEELVNLQTVSAAMTGRFQSFFDTFRGYAVFHGEDLQLSSDPALTGHQKNTFKDFLAGGYRYLPYTIDDRLFYNLVSEIPGFADYHLVLTLDISTFSNMLNKLGGNNDYLLVQRNIAGPVIIDASGAPVVSSTVVRLSEEQRKRLGSVRIIPKSWMLLVALYPEDIFTNQFKTILFEVIIIALTIMLLFFLLYRRIYREQVKVSQAETMMREIFDNIPGVVFKRCLHDKNDPRFVYLSSASKTVLGLDSVKSLDRSGVFESVIHPDDLESYRQEIQRSAAHLSTVKMDYRVKTSESDYHWVRETSTPMHDHDWQVIWHGVILDITQLKNIEDELRHSQKMDSIGQLAAGIAHEINTPTQFVSDNVVFLRDAFDDIQTVIDYCLELVEKGGSSTGTREDIVSALKQHLDDADIEFLKEEIPQAISQSRDGLERVARIVRAMKEFSHPSGALKTRIDINHVIDNAVTIARNEWKYFATMELDLAENLPLVQADAQLLGQVFLNLIVNAAHAIEAVPDRDPEQLGRITIISELRDNAVCIRIQDTGIGIPDSIRTRIFEPFFTTKEVGKGSGQGLAIAYSAIVDQHQGSINVQSQPGEGATFIIYLPIGDE
jgi:PAS domain S-box-containing protein